MTPLALAAKAELESLHAYLVPLFTGETRDLTRCESAFADSLSMITPDGIDCNRSKILTNLANATAAPGFRISIEDVEVIWESDTAVLLSYVEEQYRDGETTRRLSSALFTADRHAPSGVVWRHLHETWQEPSRENRELGGNHK
jgi:hypothetical protein